jgi:hypothetical protein
MIARVESGNGHSERTRYPDAGRAANTLLVEAQTTTRLVAHCYDINDKHNVRNK